MLENAGDGNGDFVRSSHHIQPFAYDALDCLACHEIAGQHQQGSVIVHDHNLGTTITIADNADPSTNSTEAAKLTDHCLSCHDGLGKDGEGTATDTPFSDGKVLGTDVRIIDPTYWAASASHGPSRGDRSCFGDGVFGCHDNAHGSEKTTLKAPFGVTATGPDYATQEEGFCFVCHDGSPASTDIQALFAGTYHHPINNSDAARPTGGNIGRAPECLTCHDPHEASAADKNKGVAGWSNAGAAIAATKDGGPGITYQYELCFLCHADAPAGGSQGTGGPDPNSSKRAQFDPSNTDPIGAAGFRTFHPVVGAQNNPYTSPTATNGNVVTMEPPWNQNPNEHSIITCADCHTDPNIGGPHGGGNPSMLVASISDPGGNGTPLCLVCHKATSYFSGSSGSRFGAHSNNNHGSGKGDWNDGSYTRLGGCLKCHFGGEDTVNGVITSIHGGTGTTTPNGGTIAPGWMNGNNVVNWSPGSCEVLNGGGATCKGHARTY